MSAKVTLDTYAELFDDDLDAVAVNLDSGPSSEHMAKMWSLRTHQTAQQT